MVESLRHCFETTGPARYHGNKLYQHLHQQEVAPNKKLHQSMQQNELLYNVPSLNLPQCYIIGSRPCLNRTLYISTLLRWIPWYSDCTCFMLLVGICSGFHQKLNQSNIVSYSFCQWRRWHSIMMTVIGTIQIICPQDCHWSDYTNFMFSECTASTKGVCLFMAVSKEGSCLS